MGDLKKWDLILIEWLLKKAVEQKREKDNG